jgi:hypothetical protein
MLTPLLRIATFSTLAIASLAHADIYTWTDDKGRVNISNVEPPEGARVTSVLRENNALTAANEAARERAKEALRDAEVQALAERVRQLQAEVELAKRPVPVPVAAAPAPVYVPYTGEFAPPPVQYTVINASPVMGGGGSGGCYSGWPDCQFGWYSGFYPGFYPVSVAIPRDRHFRRDHFPPPARPTPHIRGPVAPWAPMPVPGSGRGR